MRQTVFVSGREGVGVLDGVVLQLWAAGASADGREGALRARERPIYRVDLVS